MVKENKKDNAEMSVAEKLKNLYRLQTVLSSIDEKKAIRGELPLEVQDLEDEIEGLSTRVEKIQHENENIQKNVVKMNEEIELKSQLIEKYKTQLDEVRNNREYDSFNKEIEYEGLEIELRNKKIREANEAINNNNFEIKRIVSQLSERRSDLDVKRSELDEIVSETKADEEQLREEAKNLETCIEPRLLTAFKRIRKNTRNGLGIVYVQRDACGGCFNKIPPQRQLDIKMSKKIIVCEFCGRIMIDPELAGVYSAKPAVEEKPKRRRRKTTEE